jgi:hypothetical protein
MANPQSRLTQRCHALKKPPSEALEGGLPRSGCIRNMIWRNSYAVRIALSTMPFNRINVLFAILSISYISAIFLFADSPAVSAVAAYNPFSLLHIPLYALLTLLIILSLLPFKLSHSFRHKVLLDDPNALKEINDPNVPKGPNALSVPITLNGPNTPNAINAFNSKNRLLIAGLVSLIVAGADEYHQSFIATREASITDVLLDAVGIALVLWLALRFIKWHKEILKRWIE